ncbi:MAG: hypothetical protein QOF26_2918 [Baekduia sp.]|nr:hypothetical protein [Baekduia sp.]
MSRASAMALLIATMAVAGCGGGGAGVRRGDLVWEQPPLEFVPQGLASDRVVVGRVRNDSLRPLRLVAARVVVRDGAGRALRASVGFTTTYAHGLFGAFQQPSALPTEELVRLGRVVELRPGETAPFYAAWRMPAGTRGPVHVDYGAGDLTLPARRSARGV